MENVVLAARYRLAALWLSQVARAAADNCLRMFVALQVAEGGTAWYPVLLFLLGPFLLMAPVNGAISNSLPKRRVLVGSAGYSFAIVALLGVMPGASGNAWPWFLLLGLITTGEAVYSPTRYALLPAAAQDAALPLGRVMGWIEMGGAAGIVGGLVLGWKLQDVSWPGSESDLGFPTAVVAAMGLNLVGLLAALPVRFPSDIHRPEPPRQALTGFFLDCRTIWYEKEARAVIISLAGFLALTTAGALSLSAKNPEFADNRSELPQPIVIVGMGAALGSLLAGVQGHPRRALGLVPFGALGLLGAFAWAAISQDSRSCCLLLGVMGGIINVPLRTAYLDSVSCDARGNGMSLMNAANYVSMTAMALVLFALARLSIFGVTGQLWLLAGLAALGVWLTGRAWLRECFEQLMEWLMWPFYRIHANGPGQYLLPRRGALLLVANHSAWFDPLWLGKVIPRRLTAMMTSRFFDLPVLRWLLTHVARTIRVEAARFRREAPELYEAVAALDRGECVLIFPEAYMKRKTEQSLRQFGQGVWRILRERPGTPVVVCWIEGGWGSFTSYYNGPPAVNKRLDWRRRIDIAVEAPQVLAPTLLADQRATRSHLMRVCLEARRYLGLEPLTLDQMEPEEVLKTEDQ